MLSFYHASKSVLLVVMGYSPLKIGSFLGSVLIWICISCRLIWVGTPDMGIHPISNNFSNIPRMVLAGAGIFLIPAIRTMCQSNTSAFERLKGYLNAINYFRPIRFFAHKKRLFFAFHILNDLNPSISGYPRLIDRVPNGNLNGSPW